ncbi:MAG: hypothetical protein M1821_004217 [Bathelium mastoideum]|nr:MAG: hypothetical protein M1821_004217 [Bathelium mastoideum]
MAIPQLGRIIDRENSLVPNIKDIKSKENGTYRFIHKLVNTDKFNYPYGTLAVAALGLVKMDPKLQLFNQGNMGREYRSESMIPNRNERLRSILIMTESEANTLDSFVTATTSRTT